MKFKKEFFKESKRIIVFFILFTLILKLAFFKESFENILRISYSFFIVSVIPGYFLLYYWKEKLDILSRIIIGSVFSLSIVSLLTYYLNMFISFNNLIFLPLILIISGLYINRKEFFKF